MIIRQATIDDVPTIINVENKTWPNGLAATRDMFVSRIETFPQGNLVAEENGIIIGVVATEVINYDIHSIKKLTWYEVTDNGYIKNTHIAKGNILFGVDLSVTPEMQNHGVATRLLEEVGKLVLRKNLPYAILGGRIPGYYKYSHEMSAEEYVHKKIPNGAYIDPEVNFYLQAGMKILRIIPNYFTDPESENYGVLLAWKNPFYAKNNLLGKIIGTIFSKIYKVRR